MDGWTEHVIWWHVYPLGFTGAERVAVDGEPVPRLRSLEPWLDYLLDLGCNGLALGPVFASATHGYDTVDHFRVDPRLGSDEDLRWLFEACRSRGVHVLLDGVFNHVGRDFPQFRDVLEHGPSSRWASWFRLDPDAGGPDGFGYRDFEGHHELVALNHDEPEVREHVVAVMDHWLGVGASGWRLDAAYAIPQPALRAISDAVRARHPDAWLVGEVIHGDYPAFVHDGGLDSVTQYELWKAIWSAINDRNLHELAWTLERHDGFVGDFVPMTFVGNHDVTRIASRLDDPELLGHALAVLFGVAGVPSVYYGDEQAFRGVKEEREGGDDAVRPAFPAGPDELAPQGWPVFHTHQELIGMRRRNAWLAGARTSVDHVANEQLAFTSRAGDDAVTVLLNLADEEHRFDADREAQVVAGAGGADPWLVAARSWKVLR
ncbi:alpha-amylase family protein [Pseudonocardia sp. MH-G8]|uniref:alpha-amylase family protein n=1 Tax=Pseudonocardia sp. MH-G8 TaxID=1854588 RepID=UPI000B9FF528|nr:alpha-amylase family protein [Pseudonocardia sp. MH-G8]OZM83787.1 alpha-amylase [Pseudonocardia sp. MH-G8]